MPRPPAPPAAASPPTTARATALAFALVLASGLFAYQGVWHGQYVFDDVHAIAENAPLLAGDWWQAAFGPHHQPLANRPLSCLTLALDFALFGPGPFGPHLGNLLLHLANALLVFAVMRRCLLAPNLAGRFAATTATWLAASVAAVWAAHPLGVDAVAYATQRSTVLFGMCLLVACYGTLRAHGSPRPLLWRTLAVLAMAAGMASKEDMIVGPLLLVLLERAFVLPSWSGLRARVPFYGALAATWVVLAVCLWLGPKNATVGWSTDIPTSAWQWLMTQAGVVVLYLRLALWPHPLRGAYDHGIVTDLGDAVLPGLLVLALLAFVVVSWRRRPWLGWLGALFFLLLAPTSTVMPIVTEVVAERRPYLPMLFVLVPVVLGVARHLSRWPAGQRGPIAAALLLLVVGALSLRTQARVAVYHDARSFWRDAYEQRDPASRSWLAGLILINYGDTLYHAGRTAEAHACYDAMMLCQAPSTVATGRYAMSLLERQRPADAVAVLRRVARSSTDPESLGMLGLSLSVWHEAERGRADDPRLAEAETALRQSLASNPRKAHFWSALANVLRARGRLAEAAEAAQQAQKHGGG